MTAYDESSQHTEVVQFPYDQIDGLEDVTPEDLTRAIAAFEKLLNWIWQSGPKNNNGIEIRSVICCWVFLKHLRPLSLTEMAAVVGRDKQSLGRWFDEFKKDMPDIKTNHMKFK